MQPSLPSHHPLLGPDTAILAAQQQSASASFFHNQRTNTAHQDANSNAVLAPASGAMPFTVAPPQAHTVLTSDSIYERFHTSEEVQFESLEPIKVHRCSPGALAPHVVQD